MSLFSTIASLQSGIDRLQAASYVASFYRALQRPYDAQKRTLLDSIRANAHTEFGERYNLSAIQSVQAFRECVPIHEYEDLRPYLEKQQETETYRHSCDRPRLYLVTSGTTAKAKYIPVTSPTIATYCRFQAINTYFQRKAAPGIFNGKVLEIVGSLSEGIMTDGTPFGSMSGLFSECLPRSVRSRRVLPREVFDIPDYDHRYLVLAVLALSEEDISCLASANPSTFFKLLEVINNRRVELEGLLVGGDPATFGIIVSDSLKKRIRLEAPSSSRVSHLKGLFAGNKEITFADLWPKLRAVVTWTGGNCAILVPKLKQVLSPATKLLEVGYLASEFWGTIVVNPERALGYPAIQDVFFEFIDPGDWDAGCRETVLLHELQPDRRYYVIVTTRDGLYRYFINDLIETGDLLESTPAIAFVQKGKGVTSLTGEKLYEDHVLKAIEGTSAQFGITSNSFLMVADEGIFSYFLYLESEQDFDPHAYARALDDHLGTINHEYDAKLRSGRLRPTCIKRVRSGTFEEYKRRKLLDGKKDGQFKMITLQYRRDITFPFEDFE